MKFLRAEWIVLSFSNILTVNFLEQPQPTRTVVQLNNPNNIPLKTSLIFRNEAKFFSCTVFHLTSAFIKLSTHLVETILRLYTVPDIYNQRLRIDITFQCTNKLPPMIYVWNWVITDCFCWRWYKTITTTRQAIIQHVLLVWVCYRSRNRDDIQIQT